MRAQREAFGVNAGGLYVLEVRNAARPGRIPSRAGQNNPAPAALETLARHRPATQSAAMEEPATDYIAQDLFALLGTGGQSQRYPDLGMDAAYSVVARIAELRLARGERPVGRKIAFTNTTIWPIYGVAGPTWNFVYDSTVHDLSALGAMFDLHGLPEPRIEPEIVLHLARAPLPGMTEEDLLGCIDWIAHGFEIVQSVYPGWELSGPEAAAAFGLHGALLLGPRNDISTDRAGWGAMLTDFAVRLKRDGKLADTGHARNVLGGPVAALRFLVAEIARHPACAPLAAGEIVTTGTLTDAHPIGAGETWSTDLDRIPIGGLRLQFR